MLRSSFMYKAVATLVAAVGLVGGSAYADPPRASKDHWRNTNYPSHYILYDSATRTYVETVDCRALWRFRLVSNEPNTLILYDASRDMTVKINYEGMYLKPSGQAGFTYYQTGTFDTRVRFSHVDAQGNYTGTVSKRDACVWDEWFPSHSGPAFRFRQTAVAGDAVEMYDASRDMSVRLDASRMYLRTGRQPYGFFKNGAWR